MEDAIILVGGGGHCISCIDVIEAENIYNIAGIIDIEKNVGKFILGYKIIGTDDMLIDLSKKYNNFLLTIGQIKTPEIRMKIFDKLTQLNVNLPVIKSPNSYISKHTQIGEGTIVMHGAKINADTRIGKNCIINTGAIIEHNAIIGDNCHISTGSTINGGTVINQGTFIGSNVATREYVNIGSYCVIGAGLTILKDVPDNSLIK